MIVEDENRQTAPELSILMPCLNEGKTLQKCIDTSRKGIAAAACSAEIVVADNGSIDGSQQIASASGARLVEVLKLGYGSALMAGIRESRGRWVVMGDADGSYDFAEIPRFVSELRNGFDLVMGNRFRGGIQPGSMPWHHRYIGNPVLSGIGRALYRPACGDFHCGIRGFDRMQLLRLNLQSEGMEFASEMVVRFAKAKLRICEIPVFLYPDGRNRRPHLRSFRDGFRHLNLLVRQAF